jgi:TPR repeat protein
MNQVISTIVSMLFFAALTNPVLAAFEEGADRERTALLGNRSLRLENDHPLTQQWRMDCGLKGDAHACYNMGVHYARTLGRERHALRYYRIACTQGEGFGCFNMGGILVKEKDTIQRGIRLFKKACTLSKTVDQHAGTMALSCELGSIVEKNVDMHYEELAKLLMAVFE